MSPFYLKSFGDDAPAVGRNQLAEGLQFEVAAEDDPNDLGLRFVDDELLGHGVIAEWDRSPGPLALGTESSDLVPYPLRRQFPFELSKGQRHV